jgi:hypothetical protein
LSNGSVIIVAVRSLMRKHACPYQMMSMNKPPGCALQAHYTVRAAC